ncbi:MAG: hypothetical protein ABIK65_08425 [Candidatus Eisenbacteria bacterium]
MAKLIAKPARGPKRRNVRPGRGGAKTENALPFHRKNYILFAVGIFAILLGFFFLSRNSITLAPILLVAGYCVIIPLAIALK